ncbi:protein of unknown function [Halpernia humi]|uniref:AAA domain-containing protein n=1 Tax=Halpernia humi TaxID=493375 RepID=A0A1H5VYR4_9FLAO|nr:ATP-binding protein [Halpernia humi]SEF92021.1 protein of unknown function [Halpernia humi]
MVKRFLEAKLKQKFNEGKAIILMGARQVGKTTLLKNIFENENDYIWLNADEQDVINLFENPNFLRLKQFFRNKKFVIIDEAQRIPDVGLKLKLITDEIPSIQLIATGSSSFESANSVNELKSSKKNYFYDNGIRNALIANFTIAENREDIGKLWENFLVSERIKKLNYQQLWKNYWFWRTKEQKESDWLEESDGKLEAFEFKWNAKANLKVPKQFSGAYPESDFKVISQNNCEDFLL